MKNNALEITPMVRRTPSLRATGTSQPPGDASQFRQEMNRAIQTVGADKALGQGKKLDRQTVAFLTGMVRNALDHGDQGAGAFALPTGLGAVGNRSLSHPLPAFRQPLGVTPVIPSRVTPMLHRGQRPESISNQDAAKIAQSSAKTAEALSLEPLNAKPKGTASHPYDALIQKAAERYDLDEQLIKAVIRVESNFDPRAVSPAGARGLMQLMPATAKELGVRNSFDPEQNIMGGAKYLKKLLDRYDGDQDKALAAYNWGMGNLERRPQAMPKVTRQYIAKVQSLLDNTSIA